MAAERKELKRESGTLRQQTRLKQKRVTESPLENLRSSKFMTWLLQQLKRHGSIDCLDGDKFDINEYFHLYRLRGRIGYMTATACDISHLIPLKAGGSFRLDNLTILPSSVNRSQKADVMPPPLVGSTFTKHTTFNSDAELWKQLVTRYGKQLTKFASEHKNLKGSGKAEAINQILDTPDAPYVYRDTLNSMEERKFAQLCEQLNIPYKPTCNEQQLKDGKPEWDTSFIAHRFLYSVYQRCPKRLAAAGKTILQLLHYRVTFLTESEQLGIYNYRFEQALNSLLPRTAKLLNLTEAQTMTQAQRTDHENLFITADADGLNQHILVIGDESESDDNLSPEFLEAIKESHEKLRITKHNLSEVDRYASMHRCSRFTAMCRLKWKTKGKRGDLARYLTVHGMDIFGKAHVTNDDFEEFRGWQNAYSN
ncbi:TPA: hypothetical protein ACN7EE_004543 [Klebsiella pneumoniae]